MPNVHNDSVDASVSTPGNNSFTVAMSNGNVSNSESWFTGIEYCAYTSFIHHLWGEAIPGVGSAGLVCGARDRTHVQISAVQGDGFDYKEPATMLHGTT
mgnify:CR=1 FL=1